MEIDIPNGADRLKYFALFIVEGAVFPNLAQFKHVFIKNPATILKTGRQAPQLKIIFYFADFMWCFNVLVSNLKGQI